MSKIWSIKKVHGFSGNGDVQALLNDGWEPFSVRLMGDLVLGGVGIGRIWGVIFGNDEIIYLKKLVDKEETP